jgi:hypothetical protein
MKLGEARLCLDCDEVHDSQQCPICTSESFAFITRWVPGDDHRTRVRMSPSAAPPARTPGSRLVKRGAIGLAAVAVAGWLLGRGDKPPQGQDG